MDKKKTFLITLTILTLIQMKVTYIDSKAQDFSKSLVIRNCIISGLIAFFLEKNNNAPLKIKVLIVILCYLASILIHFILTIIETKLLLNPIDNLNTCKYLYHDLFEDLINYADNDLSRKLALSLTEGYYPVELVGFDTENKTPENIHNIYSFLYNLMDQSINRCKVSNKDYTYSFPKVGIKDIRVLEKESQNKKYKWFLDKCEINETTRLLELGFGYCGFMDCARSYGIKDIVGISISSVQTKIAQEKGYTAYTHDFTKLNELDIGLFDIIIINGSFEYALEKPQCDDKLELAMYTKILGKVSSKLKKGGVVLNTIITRKIFHHNYDYNFFTLWLGNNGNYPTEEIWINAWKNNNVEVVEMQDHTIDYAIWSTLWCMNNEHIPERSLVKALYYSFGCPYYLLGHLCYNGLPRIMDNDIRIKYYPWLQQFFPKKIDGQYKYDTQYAKHRWFIFKKYI